ncbi:hypothetical protein FG152_24695 [Ochrobactrum sp. XJ1]|nr:hypothetical protein [Ochrobactrum sp. XJ1]
MHDLSVKDLATMMGLRLVVRAARLECNTEVQRDLHQRLLNHLEMKIEEIREIIELGRSEDEELGRYHYEGWLGSYFHYEEIPLLDEVYVDTDTGEYCVNDGEWRFGRPTRNKLSKEELGPLADLFALIRRESHFYVSATHIF